jgi:hypothetical protein
MTIYLASPYSHPDPGIREQRFEAACLATAELVRRGTVVFSPIVHGHPLVRFGLPTTWEYWSRFDHEYLRRCDRMIVLMLDSWQDSRGVQAEISLARELGLPIDYATLSMISNVSGGDTSMSVRPLSQEMAI